MTAVGLGIGLTGAGMNAVYIPSARSWEYEHEEIRQGVGELLVLASFRELRERF